MTLISMKTGDEGYAPSEPNPYGYGLCLSLNDEQCAALGITTPPAAGTVLMLTAKTYVESATQSVEDDGDDTNPDVCLRLQITDLALGSDTSKPDPAKQASMLYGE